MNIQEEFMEACESGNIGRAIHLLKDPRFNVNKADQEGKTPLYTICENGYIEIENDYMEIDNDHMEVENDYIMATENDYIEVENGYREIAEYLLKDPRIDVNKANKEGKTPFYIACENGNIEVIEHLLKDPRIDVNKANKKGNTPFYLACENGHMEVVELLLQNPRINVNQANKEGDTPFFIACQLNNVKVVKLLLKDPRIDVTKAESEYGQTPFCIACEKDHKKVVELLLKDPRIDVNKVDNEGQTPFYVACEYGNIEVVKLLLKDPRIDVNKVDNEGQTPFYRACENEWRIIARMIIANALAKASEEQIRDFDPNESFNENLLRFSKAVGLVNEDVDDDLFDDDLFDEELPDEILQDLKEIKSYRQDMATQIYTLVAMTFPKNEKDQESLLRISKDPEQDESKQEVKQKNARRYLEIAKRLPVELLGILANRSIGSNNETVPSGEEVDETIEEILTAMKNDKLLPSTSIFPIGAKPAIDLAINTVKQFSQTR